MMKYAKRKNKNPERERVLIVHRVRQAKKYNEQVHKDQTATIGFLR